MVSADERRNSGAKGVSVGRAGFFIAFEGGECTGKTTEAKLLAKHLVSRGREVVVTKEPGGTPEGERIKQEIYKGGHTPEEEVKLFLEDRSIHVREVIRPALERGAVVISDRFADSTRAYQHYARGFSLENIECGNAEATGGLSPDLVIVIDVPPEKAFLRLSGRGEPVTTYERENMDFHRKLRDGFLTIAANNPRTHVVIDGDRDINAISADIARIVDERLR